MTSSIEATSSANRVTHDDLGSEEAFLAAIDETIKYFNDGDIVEGTVVKVDRDEVLLDIGYKTEGVIPSRELSIKHDVDPAEVVSVGDRRCRIGFVSGTREGLHAVVMRTVSCSMRSRNVCLGREQAPWSSVPA